MSTTKPLELIVEAKAQLITNNLPEFEKAFRAGLETFKYELIDDDDFAKAKEDLKIVKKTEDQIKAVDQAIVNGSADIKAIRESLAKLGEEARSFRLGREKLIKSRDAEIVAKIKSGAIESIPIKHPDAERRIEAAMKGKRTLKSLKNAADGEAFVIEAEVLAAREVVEQFREDHGADIVHDERKLFVMDSEVVEVELARRVERKVAAIKEAESLKEAERLRSELAAKKDELPAEPIEEPKEIPPPPAIDTIMVGGQEEPEPQSESDEMTTFLALIKASFSPVRDARVSLKHPNNKAKAEDFAEGLRSAWIKIQTTT